jgi:hypothetical protein
MEFEVEEKYLNDLASACKSWDGKEENFPDIEIPQTLLDKYGKPEIV